MGILNSLQDWLFSFKRKKNGKDHRVNYQEKKEKMEKVINVYDCMIPLNEIVTLSVQSSFESVLDQMGYSSKNALEENQKAAVDFALIYHENTNDLVGIIKSKDLVWRLKHRCKKDGCDFLFSSIIFTPFNMTGSNALELMKKKNTSILLVVDSKGGTLGAVTKDSIIDYVFNYEEVYKYFNEYVRDGQISVDGTTLLKHMPDDWSLKEFEDCYISGTRTLGGFLGYYTGVIPKQESEIIIGKFKYKVIEGNDRFVKTILITKLENE